MKILVFEDSPLKMQSLEELLNVKLEHEYSRSISFTIRTDESFLESDLMTNQYLMILIDDDLGNNLSGSFIIEKIISTLDNSPEFKNITLVYYSAGTSVPELKAKSAKFGNIICTSFENLEEFISNFVKKRI